MFQIDVSYPSHDEEVEIVKTTTGTYKPDPAKILDSKKIMEYQELVHRVPVPDHVAEYAVRVARATRPEDPGTPESVRQGVSWGVGPRASQYLILGSKARAVLSGRYTPTTDDVKAIAPAVLKHRVVLNFRAEAEGVKPDDIIREILVKIDPLGDARLRAS
jgi:MoxR-like ATPase